jgi:hypothetical protein
MKGQEMEKKRIVRRSVDDLGEAAYIRMKNYRCVGRKARSFYFDISEEEIETFESLNLEYINSPYHDFDSCIMSLKKVVERLTSTANMQKPVPDLGAAAYLKMHGFKCAGRRGRNFYFEVAEEDLEKFDMLNLEYVNSSYHAFDSAIMCLKKIGEYLSS